MSKKRDKFKSILWNLMNMKGWRIKEEKKIIKLPLSKNCNLYLMKEISERESHIFFRPNRDQLRKKNVTLGPPAGNRIHNPASLVRRSACWAMKAIADSLAVSSIIIIVVMPVNRRVHSTNIFH